MEELTNIPARLYAGDSISLEKTFSDNPSDDGWSVIYYFKNASNSYSASAVADGNGGYTLTVASATTAAWSAGEYQWFAVATKAGGLRATVDQGAVEVLPDIAAAGNVDLRSDAQITLDNIEAVIQNRASIDQMSFSINGKSLARTPVADLLKLRDTYRAEVKREKAALRLEQGLGTGAKILTRFNN